MQKRWGMRCLLLVVMGAGCAPRGGDGASAPARSPLAPNFAPSVTGSATTTPTSVPGEPVATTISPSSSGVGAGTATSGGLTPVPTSPLSAHVTDPEGDLTPSPTDPPPPWADLRGATLTRIGNEFELAIDLAGDVPTRATDDDHTMNVAAFYDLDGDGQIDAEIWVNLADDGWGGAYYDNRARTAAFARDSQVVVRVEQRRLVLRVPASHLHDATAFRWSIASEWGRYEAIGTPVAARDDAPGDDAAVQFPG